MSRGESAETEGMGVGLGPRQGAWQGSQVRPHACPPSEAGPAPARHALAPPLMPMPPSGHQALGTQCPRGRTRGALPPPTARLTHPFRQMPPRPSGPSGAVPLRGCIFVRLALTAAPRPAAHRLPPVAPPSARAPRRGAQGMSAWAAAGARRPVARHLGCSRCARRSEPWHASARGPQRARLSWPPDLRAKRGPWAGWSGAATVRPRPHPARPSAGRAGQTGGHPVLAAPQPRDCGRPDLGPPPSPGPPSLPGSQGSLVKPALLWA